MKKMQIAVVALVLALGFSAAYAATTPMPYPVTMAELNAVYAYTNPALVASCVTNTDIVLGKTNITIQTMTTNDTLYALRMTTIPSGYTCAGLVAPIDLNKMFEESNIYTVTVIKTNDNWQYLSVYTWTTNTTMCFTNALGTVIPATTTTYRHVTQVWTNLWDAGSVTSTFTALSMYIVSPYANGNDLIAIGANMSNQVTTLTNALEVGLEDANLRITNYTTAAVGVLAANMSNQVTTLTNALEVGLEDANLRMTNFHLTMTNALEVGLEDLALNLTNQALALTNALEVGLEDANLRITNFTGASIALATNGLDTAYRAVTFWEEGNVTSTNVNDIFYYGLIMTGQTFEARFAFSVQQSAITICSTNVEIGFSSITGNYLASSEVGTNCWMVFPDASKTPTICLFGAHAAAKSESLIHFFVSGAAGTHQFTVTNQTAELPGD